MRSTRLAFSVAAAVIALGFGIAGGLAAALAAEDAKANPVGAGGWSAQVSADPAGGITLDETQTAVVQKVSDYFNNLKSISGDFVQTAADKSVMKGDFAMQQPGRFRFDYSRPSRQIVISDGTYLAIQDLDLSNEDRVALDQTPFRILLRKDVNLLRDAKIIEIQDTGEQILVALQDKDPDAAGKIRLFLKTTPELELQGWTTTDAQGLDTRIDVSNLKRDAEIKAEKFVIKSVSKPFQQ